MRTPGRRRDKEATRERIFRAASEEFAQFGFSGTSLARIARRAGCSKAIIHRYFGKKEDLYRSALNANYAELSRRETVHITSQTPSVQEMLEGILGDLFAFNREHPSFARLVAWENLAGARYLKAREARAAREPGLRKLRSLLEEAVGRGLVRADLDLDRLVYMLQAITVVYFSNRHTMRKLTGIPFGSRTTMREFIAFYASILANGITSTRGEEP